MESRTGPPRLCLASLGESFEEGRDFPRFEGLPFLGEAVLEVFRWGDREVHRLLGLGSRGCCERAESREGEEVARDLGGGEPDRPDGGGSESGPSRVTFLS